ncbi:MAG TPA: hypothetical protein PKW80_07225 [Bacteroidales bacterium]|nr:hypothetical protein [Bacteroidales bacterium]
MKNQTEDNNKCPVTGKAGKHSVAAGGTKNLDWWPKQLKLNIPRQHSAKSNPLGQCFYLNK